MQEAKVFPLIHRTLYLIFFASLVCSFRAVAAIVIPAMLIAGITNTRLETGSFFNDRIKNPFVVCCILLFLFSLTGVLTTFDTKGQWNAVLLSCGLLFIPLAVVSSSHVNENSREKLLNQFILIVLAASLACLISATIDFVQTESTSVFFYHALVSPFRHHAVYFSILVFICLVYLVERASSHRLVYHPAFHYSSLIFLSLFLFLLSSKLVVGFYVFYLLFRGVQGLFKRRSRLLFVILLCIASVLVLLILFLKNPVSARFRDIFHNRPGLVTRDSFRPDDYFNGLQFRLVQWRLTREILNENQAWWQGVSQASAQKLLDQKYMEKNMYTGDPATGTTGYRGYNTHNQFLQTLLESGIPGLVVLLAACTVLASIFWKIRGMIGAPCIILLFLWLFTEAILGRQLGIMIFCFFPLFFSLGQRNARLSG